MAPSLKMTREEREVFLAQVHVGVISIEEPGRGPLSAPVWYDYAPGHGVWLITGRDSRKGRLLERAGRFSLVAQTEAMPYRYVSVEGPVAEVRASDKEADRRPMARRYLGEAAGDAYADGPTGADDHVYVMHPQRWLTVDYGKLAAGS